MRGRRDGRGLRVSAGEIGDDQDAKPRFISSRKTGNEPTFADLGGTSVLTGTGLYARALRKVRRF